MSNGLEHIAKILKELNEELKLDNDKWEKAQNGRSNVLPTSDARTGNDTSCPYKSEGESK